MLGVLDNMAAMTKEKRDTLLGWPWPLFCRYWERLFRYAHEQRKEERKRKAIQREAKDRQEWGKLRAAHRTAHRLLG